MKLRTAIVEDQKPDAERLEQLLKKAFGEEEIHYAMAQNHFVKVVTDDGECRAAANFAQVQEQLTTQPDFLVCNRGIIINMSKVLRFDGECIEMLDGARLPVRQKDKKSLLAQFTQYQFRNMQRQM